MHDKKEKPPRGPRDFLTVLFKHRIKVGGFFLASVLIAAVGSFLLPPTYEARSSLTVKTGREYVTPRDSGDAGALMLIQLEEVVNSEVRILSSRELIEKVLATMKVETVYPELAAPPLSTTTPLQAAALAFKKNLTVEGVKKSNVIEVAFRHKDPRVAARAVNLLVDGYREKHLRVFSDPRASFLEKQLAGYDAKRKDSEQRMEAFRRKNRFFFPEEQKSLLLKRYQEANLLVQNTRREIRLARERPKERETVETPADLPSLNAEAAAQARRVRALEDEIRAFDRLDTAFQALKREADADQKTYRAGLGLAFLSESASESFSTPGIAERQLALPVLATIRHRD